MVWHEALPPLARDCVRAAGLFSRIGVLSVSLWLLAYSAHAQESEAVLLPPPEHFSTLETLLGQASLLPPGVVPQGPPPLPVEGSRPILVLLAELADAPHDPSHTKAYFEGKFFRSGPPSVRHYYDEVSYGRFTFVPGAVVGWLPSKVITQRPLPILEIFPEAIANADDAFDFGKYDTNDDGLVENEELAVFIIVSGDLDIGVHFSLGGIFGMNAPTADGVFVESDFSLTDEFASLAVLCHELGHELGLPDLYPSWDPNAPVSDCDASPPGLFADAAGIGVYGLMGRYYPSWYGVIPGSGIPHMTAWSKLQLGWLNPQIVNECGSYELRDAETNPDALIVVDSNRSTSEYFLVENRQPASSFYERSGWPTPSGGFPDQGVLIYHIDDARLEPWLTGGWNVVNCNEAHKAVDVECADAPTSHVSDADDLDAFAMRDDFVVISGNSGDSSDLWDSSEYDFSDVSVPSSAQWYDGSDSGMVIGRFSAPSSSMLVEVSTPACAEARCSAEPGSCKAVPACDPQPLVCPANVDPVCGCDGITYSNSCKAVSNGVSVDFDGECNGNFLAFDGRVTSVSDQLSTGPIAVGDPIRVIYKFDPRAEDANASPTVGVYGPLSRFSYAIGSYRGEVGTGSSSVKIWDNYPTGSSPTDGYSVLVSQPAAPDLAFHSPWSVGILLTASQLVFSSDALFIGPPDLSRFEGATFVAAFADKEEPIPIIQGVIGEITNVQLIPDLIAFEGDVTFVGNQVAGGPIEVGDPIQGIYQVDPSLDDPAFDEAIYSATLRSFSYSFGSYVGGLGGSPYTGVFIYNDEGPYQVDTYLLRNEHPSGPSIAGNRPRLLYMILSDVTGSAYSGETLPVAAPELRLFTDDRRVVLDFNDILQPPLDAEWTVRGEASRIRSITRIAGDVNADGKVTVIDVIRVHNLIVGNMPPPLFCADWNGDGRVDVRDAILAQNTIVEKIAHRPCARGEGE